MPSYLLIARVGAIIFPGLSTAEMRSEVFDSTLNCISVSREQKLPYRSLILSVHLADASSKKLSERLSTVADTYQLHLTLEICETLSLCITVKISFFKSPQKNSQEFCKVPFEWQLCLESGRSGFKFTFYHIWLNGKISCLHLSKVFLNGVQHNV